MARLTYPQTPEELQADLISAYPAYTDTIRSTIDWDHLNAPEVLEDFFRNILNTDRKARQFINSNTPRQLRLPTLLEDLEIPLTLTDELKPGNYAEATEIRFGFNEGIDQTNIFAFDIWGLDTNGGGILIEGGANVSGIYVGFRSNGDFVARCGDGGSNDTDYPLVLIPAVDAPRGDGTMIVEFTERQATNGQNTVRVWWNNIFRGESTQGLTGKQTSGNDAWSFGVTTTSNLVAGEVNTTVEYDHISLLRFYGEQSIS